MKFAVLCLCLPVAVHMYEFKTVYWPVIEQKKIKYKLKQIVDRFQFIRKKE